MSVSPRRVSAWPAYVKRDASAAETPEMNA